MSTPVVISAMVTPTNLGGFLDLTLRCSSGNVTLSQIIMNAEPINAVIAALEEMTRKLKLIQEFEANETPWGFVAISTGLDVVQLP